MLRIIGEIVLAPFFTFLLKAIVYIFIGILSFNNADWVYNWGFSGIKSEPQYCFILALH
jgi:hypothetical protein